MIGSSIAHYKITQKLGAGGMGEVYRARDERLGRDVALKVLPQALAADTARMARFGREAQLLAALNHPHIASIYGLEEAGTTRALVMELLEGPTLAEHIASGPLPLDEALSIARQIAEALEYAHDRGIIHRDLKPGNIKITPEGKVKVLDFGLAKALEGDPAGQDISASPTLTFAATQAGVILGTAAYMSPEQAKGRAADRRADVWSFGVVLYEMLTGRMLFSGDTVSETLASVIKDEPGWNRLPADLPPTIQRLLRRCLTRDPRQRLQAVGEARITIEQYLANPAAAQNLTPQAAGGQNVSLGRRLMPWAVAAAMGLAAAVSLWGWLRIPPSPAPVVRRFVVELPKGQVIGGPVASLALSPDGAYLAYDASRMNGAGWQLHLRAMDQFESQPLGTEEGADAFFSPDGQWVGFFAGGKLKKVSVRGGTPIVLAQASRSFGAAWGSDGKIIYSPEADSGLWEVSEAGGPPQRLTQPDTARGERGHRWPEILPGGHAVLFAMIPSSGTYDQSSIAVLSLKTGKWRTLIEGGSNPKYVSSGHLIFARAGTLMAAPFDPDRLEMTGAPVPVLEGVFSDNTTNQAFYSVSADGMLVYMPASTNRAEANQFVWVSRKGAEQPLAAPARPYQIPRLSPDGRQIAVRMAETNVDIWVYDMARGALPRLTFQPGEDEAPAWTRDGKRVAYGSSQGSKPRTIFWRNADGSGVEEVLFEGGQHTHPNAFSPDGRFFAFTDYDPASKGDIFVLPLSGDRKPQPFLKTPFNEYDALFSPDGHWLAYTSDESGQNEIYVQAFPGPGGKAQVSTDGGHSPVWSRDGKELFYRNGSRMMAATVTFRPSFSASSPRVLFEGIYLDTPRRETNYDVSPDGQRFLMLKGEVGGTGPTQYHVVLNWSEELKRRVPPPRR